MLFPFADFREPEDKGPPPQNVSDIKQKFTASILALATAEASSRGKQLSPDAASGIADLAWTYAETLSADVWKFSKHAGRKTVQIDDVMLTARRNPSLEAALAAALPQAADAGGGASGGRKRARAASGGEAVGGGEKGERAAAGQGGGVNGEAAALEIDDSDDDGGDAG